MNTDCFQSLQSLKAIAVLSYWATAYKNRFERKPMSGTGVVSDPASVLCRCDAAASKKEFRPSASRTFSKRLWLCFPGHVIEHGVHEL